ncbi:hypothetical protein CVV73_27020, partial [Enterobacter hormaechei]
TQLHGIMAYVAEILSSMQHGRQRDNTKSKCIETKEKMQVKRSRPSPLSMLQAPHNAVPCTTPLL